MNEYYILIDILEQPINTAGVTRWRLTFQGLMSNDIVEMTVDSNHKNFRRAGWQQVLTSDQPWGVYNTLERTDKTTRRGAAIISADSAAEIIYRCADHKEVLDLAQASLRHNSPAERFENLFE